MKNDLPKGWKHHWYSREEKRSDGSQHFRSLCGNVWSGDKSQKGDQVNCLRCVNKMLDLGMSLKLQPK